MDARGLEVPKHLREALKNLIQASDEPETRTAWMEHLANAGQCPMCDAPLGLVERSSGPHVQCSSSPTTSNATSLKASQRLTG